MEKSDSPKVSAALIKWMIFNMEEAKTQIELKQIKKEDLLECIHEIFNELDELKEFIFEEKRKESSYAFYKDNVIMAPFNKQKSKLF